MSDISYSKSCTQALVLLKQLPENEYIKIPKREIEYLEKNKDTEYNFKLDYSKPLEEQDISITANSILVRIFRDYFATDTQKEKLKVILDSNLKKAEQLKKEQYNPDEIFKNKTKSRENIDTESENEVTSMTVHKESIFKRLLNWIKLKTHMKT